MVLRDAKTHDVPVEEVVPGDVVILEAGDMVPADSLILEAKDLFVDEATLTGETMPAEKVVESLPPETPLAERRNSLFMGTHVLSGMAHAVVVNTGKNTEFGKISETLRLRPAETEFEHGVHRFGYFLVEVTMILVVAIFAINVFLARPILESFLFSLALAVGLTPQLLPAIISVNLAHGARRLASEKVIVKRLSSIENFGSMDVLCSDKTGTLTKGIMRFRSAICPQGDLRDKLSLYAYLNAYSQSGFQNPIDQALLDQLHPDISGYQKLDEVPYDFVRKRLTVMVAKDTHHLMIVKGAFASVMQVSSLVEAPDGTMLEMVAVKGRIERRFEELSQRGFRVLGLAYRDLPDAKTITRDDEVNMVFLGLLVFYDPPKTGIIETIKELKQLGTSLKVISGDNRFVVKNLGEQFDLGASDIITGTELREMSNEALLKRVAEVSLFAEIEPQYCDSCLEYPCRPV
jgi:Mg2+-importing ATPase